MTLVEKYRQLFQPRLWLETKWRGVLGKTTKFPSSYGDLSIDSDVRYDPGRLGILLLLIQSNGSSSPTEALIGIIVANGCRGEPTTHQQRCPLADVHTVSSHGGQGHEAEPSQS